MKLIEDTIYLDGVAYPILRGGKKGGTPILFLHGWDSRAERYRSACEFLPEDFSEIVIPDLPGFGKAPAPKAVWGVEEYAVWADKLIGALGWQKLILAGHSFGGRVTIYLAANKPEKINGILLYAAAGVTKRNQTKLSFFGLVAKTGKTLLGLPGLRFIYPFARKVLYQMIGNKDYLRAGEKREIFKKIISEDLSETVKKISVPAQLLWGAEDFQTPLADAEYIKQNLKECELTVVPGQGHAIHIKSPEMFANIFSELIFKLLKKENYVE